MEIYTKQEMKMMEEFDCTIHKLCNLWDMTEQEQDLIEHFGEDVSQGLPYIEKNYADGNCRMKVVVVFHTHEGMNLWMKKWPGDQRFIVKDFQGVS